MKAVPTKPKVHHGAGEPYIICSCGMALCKSYALKSSHCILCGAATPQVDWNETKRKQHERKR